MTTPRNAPDPVGLAIAREIQEKVRPAEIILGGSRAVGEHRPDSDVDLTAIAPDEDGAERTREILRELLEGKTSVPVVNAYAVTRADFQHWALQAQSFAGQSARYGVTPEPGLPAGEGTHAGGGTGADSILAHVRAQPLDNHGIPLGRR